LHEAGKKNEVHFPTFMHRRFFAGFLTKPIRFFRGPVPHVSSQHPDSEQGYRGRAAACTTEPLQVLYAEVKDWKVYEMVRN